MSSHSSKDLSYHRRTSEHPEKLPENIYDCSTPERENATQNPLLFDILVITVSYVEVVPNNLQSRYIYIYPPEYQHIPLHNFVGKHPVPVRSS